MTGSDIARGLAVLALRQLATLILWLLALAVPLAMLAALALRAHGR